MKRDKKKLGGYIYYTGIGFQMIATIGIFAFIGYKIDERRNGDKPIFTAVLSLIGVGVSIYSVIRSLLKQNRN